MASPNKIKIFRDQKDDVLKSKIEDFYQNGDYNEILFVDHSGTTDLTVTIHYN